MDKSVIIIGASGHGKVVADIIRCSGDRIIGFLDDNTNLGDTFIGYPVLGTIEEYKKYSDAYYIVAIGNAKEKEKIAKKLEGVKWYTAIHPSAVVSKIDTNIDEGTAVMATAVINSGAYVGKHCIVNSGAIIEHDNKIEDFVHVSVGAKLAGNVHVGKRSWIGIGTAVSNNLSICKDCMIGAGGVVVKDINEPGTYVGVPVKRLKKDKGER